MSHDDFNSFKYDCDHAEVQKAFLENQLKNISRFDLNNPDRPIINYVLDQLRRNCMPPKTVVAGCVHVREDMSSGSAMATVCNSGGMPPRERPIVNHWDPLVDMR
jgi:hypothetical protein